MFFRLVDPSGPSTQVPGPFLVKWKLFNEMKNNPRYRQWSGNGGKLLARNSPMANSRCLTPWKTDPSNELHKFYSDFCKFQGWLLIMAPHSPLCRNKHALRAKSLQISNQFKKGWLPTPVILTPPSPLWNTTNQSFYLLRERMGEASDDDFDLFYLVGDFIHILCKGQRQRRRRGAPLAKQQNRPSPKA